MNTRADSEAPGAAIHWPCLVLAIAIMLGITLYPPMLADAAGKADHRVATLMFWAMSAGFVRGVGFVPHARAWRWLFSVHACAITFAAALLLSVLD